MAASIKIPTTFTANDKFSDVLKRMTKSNQQFYASLKRIGHRANEMSRTLAVSGLAVVGGFGVAINSATAFEDRMADVAKTTGLSGKGLDNLGSDILGMSKKTRSSIEDLQQIAVIGGQLGIAKDQLLDFTKAGNKFSVALAGDYSGGVESAVLQVGKLNSLYSDTKSLKIDDHLNRAGSAFNQLSSEGKASVENINDFASRVGTLPGVLKPSFTSTAALGAFLEEVGINSERGASGFSTLILTAGKELPNFAHSMNMTTNEVRELLTQDPVKFAQKFSRSLNGLTPDKLASKLKFLGIGGQEAIKVVGALGVETDRLTDLMKSSNKAFESATSLTDEYNVKNETTAAKIAMARNNMEALGITIGTQVAPVLSKLIDMVIPLVDRFSKWAGDNPALLKTIAGLGIVILGLSGILKAVSVVTNVASLAMVAYNSVMTWYSAAAVTAALTGATFATVVWATVWPVLAVIAAITAIIAIFYYWDDIVSWFGKQWDSFVGLLTDAWDRVKDAFADGGFFKAMGQIIIEALVLPIKGLLKLISYIPGSIGEMATKGLGSIDNMLNINAVGDKNTNDNGVIDTQGAANDGVTRAITEKNSNVRLEVESKNSVVTQKENDSGIPVNISNTLAY